MGVVAMPFLVFALINFLEQGMRVCISAPGAVLK